jgi:uncharacterized metal-binding protein
MKSQTASRNITASTNLSRISRVGRRLKAFLALCVCVIECEKGAIMPSYRTHVTVNLCFGLPLALLSFKLGNIEHIPGIALFSTLFCYGTFFLNPDLDLTRQIKILSWRGLLTLPFRLYSHLFRHRGISHIPVVGTATRILWLLANLWVACAIFKWEYPNLLRWDSLLWYGIGGLAVADLFHIVLDELA